MTEEGAISDEVRKAIRAEVSAARTELEKRLETERKFRLAAESRLEALSRSLAEERHARTELARTLAATAEFERVARGALEMRVEALTQEQLRVSHHAYWSQFDSSETYAAPYAPPTYVEPKRPPRPAVRLTPPSSEHSSDTLQPASDDVLRQVEDDLLSLLDDSKEGSILCANLPRLYYYKFRKQFNPRALGFIKVGQVLARMDRISYNGKHRAYITRKTNEPA